MADGSTEILRVDGDELTAVYSCTQEETCASLRFLPDGERVYMQTNRGDADLVRLVLFNPADGSEELAESDPEGQVDFGGAIFSNATDELLATTYVGDRRRIYARDPQFERDLEALRTALPEGCGAHRRCEEDAEDNPESFRNVHWPGSSCSQRRASTHLSQRYQDGNHAVAALERAQSFAEHGTEGASGVVGPHGVTRPR